MKDIEQVELNRITGVIKEAWNCGFNVKDIYSDKIKNVDSEYLWKPIKCKKGKLKIVLVGE